jgi:hypothetical protein
MPLRRIAACLAVLLVSVSSLLAVETGKADGTVTINRKPVKLKYAFARKDKDSDDKDRYTVFLTDRPVSRSVLADDQRLSKAVANGDIVALKLEFDGARKLTHAETMSKVLQHKTLPMMSEQFTVTAPAFTATSAEAAVATTQDQEFFSDVATANVKFHAVVGANQKFGDNPAAAKELAASGPKIADGTAKGSLKMDGKSIALTHVVAHRKPNTFHEEKMDTVLYLTDRELTPEMAADESKIDDAVSDGKLQGLRLEIDEEEAPVHLMFLLPKNNLQLSGSGFLNFDSTDFSDKHVAGRFYTTSEQDFMDKHKYTYDVTFAAPVVTIVKPKEPTADATNGTKLPANGGDPGKVYMAFDKASRSGNLNEIKKYGSKTMPMPKMSDEDTKKMLELMKMMRPSKIRILGGFANADHATLTVDGEDPMDKSKAHGTVELAKEDGAWKILKEKWSN